MATAPNPAAFYVARKIKKDFIADTARHLREELRKQGAWAIPFLGGCVSTITFVLKDLIKIGVEEGTGKVLGIGTDRDLGALPILVATPNVAISIALSRKTDGPPTSPYPRPDDPGLRAYLWGKVAEAVDEAGRGGKDGDTGRILISLLALIGDDQLVHLHDIRQKALADGRSVVFVAMCAVKNGQSAGTIGPLPIPPNLSFQISDPQGHA